LHDGHGGQGHAGQVGQGVAPGGGGDQGHVARVAGKGILHAGTGRMGQRQVHDIHAAQAGDAEEDQQQDGHQQGQFDGRHAALAPYAARAQLALAMAGSSWR
jgi:hypothetical protein